eukprot:SAG25_NODE_2702_length_1438_cov_1.353996_2_plen_118_part_00
MQGIFVLYKWFHIKHGRFLRKVWARADRDNSGCLDRSEMSDLLVAMGLIPAKASLQEKEATVSNVAGDKDTIKFGDFIEFWEAQEWDVKSHLFDVRCDVLFDRPMPLAVPLAKLMPN